MMVRLCSGECQVNLNLSLTLLDVKLVPPLHGNDQGKGLRQSALDVNNALQCSLKLGFLVEDQTIHWLILVHHGRYLENLARLSMRTGPYCPCEGT